MAVWTISHNPCCLEHHEPMYEVGFGVFGCRACGLHYHPWIGYFTLEESNYINNVTKRGLPQRICDEHQLYALTHRSQDGEQVWACPREGCKKEPNVCDQISAVAGPG